MLRSMFSRNGCLHVTRLLQSYLDGELDAPSSRVIAEHLEDCRRCGLEASTYRAIKTAVADGGQGPASVEPEAVARLRHFAQELAERG